MRRFFDWLLGGGSAKSRKGRKSRRRARAAELAPTLEVRTLEERRVFHAGAVAPLPGGSTTPTPPPAPTTTVSLDANQNLYVHDSTTGGQNDQLTIRFDAEHQGYLLSDATHLLETDIAGATGSGTSEIFIPIAAVAGNKLIFDTAGGDDSLTVDLSAAPAGQTIVFDGGAGQHDTLNLVGGSFATANYLLADGSTQINLFSPAGSTTLELTSVEPIYDGLAVGNRQFTVSGGSAPSSWTLSSKAATSGQISLFSSLGTSVVFATPESMLSVDAGLGSSLQIVGQFDLAGDLTVRADSIDVSGTLTAQGGIIDLQATTSLTVSASGVISNSTGLVHLDAGAEGTLEFAGQIDVSGQLTGQVGGTVHLLGRQVALIDSARIDASGQAGGGNVLIGGDFQGNNEQIRNATNTWVGEDVAITSNALDRGNGGKIIVWANDTALVFGSGNLQARGGASGGNGGLIETSGKRYLYVGDAPDAGTVSGAVGMWLLDPLDVSIVSVDAVPVGVLTGTNPATFTPVAGNTEIRASTIATALLTSDVTITTGTTGSDDGDISVLAAISVVFTASGSHTLALVAADDIFVSAGISCSTLGAIGLVLTAGGDITISADIDTSGGSANVTSGGNIDFSGSSTLTSGSASFLATGTITGGSAAVDIDTSATNGLISLTGNGGIGSSVSQPFVVKAGTGDVTLTTTASAGSIFLNSSGSLDLGAVSTAAGSGQTVDIRVSGSGADMNLVASSTTNDDWNLDASDGIALVGSAALTAARASLSAGGSITGGSATVDLDTSSANGTISLSADGGIGGSTSQPFIIKAGTGDVTLTTAAAAGNIFLSSSGSLDLGAVSTDGTDAQSVDIRATGTGADINLVAVSTTNDSWNLVAVDGISLVGSAALTAASASLSAGGSITGGSATVDITTSASNGAISLTGNGGIGAGSNPLVVSAGTGDVTLTTTAATGHIYLRSSGSLDLGAVTTNSTTGQTIDIQTTTNGADINLVNDSSTNDNWTLSANDDIVFGNSATLTAVSAKLSAGGKVTAVTETTPIVDLVTSTSVTITAAQIGEASNDRLILQPGSGTVALNLTSDSGIFVELAGGSFLSQKLSIDSPEDDTPINLLVSGGNLTFDDNSGLASLSDDFLAFATTGSTASVGHGIVFNANVSLYGATVKLTSAGSIQASAGTGAIDTSSYDGNITLIAANGIGTAATPLQLSFGLGELRVDSAAGEIGLSLPTGDFSFASIKQLNSGGVGVTVTLQAVLGDILVDDVSGIGDTASASTIDDDHVRLVALANDVIFSSGDPLLVGSAEVRAYANIINAATSVDDVNLSATGDIDLITGDSLDEHQADIGTVDDPLLLRSASGAVSADNSLGTGEIGFYSDQALSIGQILTNDGVADQGILISTAGSSSTLTFTVDIDVNDEILLGSGENLVLADGVTIKANTFLPILVQGLVLGGALTGTDAHFDSSATNADIAIVARGIGAPDNLLVLNAGTGLLDLAAVSGDLCVAVADGDLTATRFKDGEISVHTTGVTIGLGTRNGSIDFSTDLPTVAGTAISTLVGNGLSLEARGTDGNIYLGGLPLTFASVTLRADGSILGFNSGTAIDTSAAGGDITLESYGAIGSFAIPLLVDAGTGTVSVTTTGPDGDIYIESDGALDLGQFNAADNTQTQTISVFTTGAMTISSPSVLANDDLVLTGQLGILFTDSGSVRAKNVSLNTLGAILSDSSAAADVEIDSDGLFEVIQSASIGTAASPLSVQANGGDLNLNSFGSVYLTIPSGNFNTQQIIGLSTAGQETFSLTVEDGSLTIGNSLSALNDDIVLLKAQGTGSNIEFEVGRTLSARSAELTADGGIFGGAGDGFTDTLDINTSGWNGSITLKAAGPIGSPEIPENLPTPLIPANPLRISAGSGVVSAETTAPTGDIYLDALGNVQLGAIISGASAHLVATGTIFSGAAPLDIDTTATGGEIELVGAVLGSSTAPLVIDSAGGELKFTATGGGIWVDFEQPDVASSQITTLGASPGATIRLVVRHGDLKLNDLSGFMGTQFNTILLEAEEDIEFSGPTTLFAGSANLTAGGSIVSGSAAVDIDTSFMGGSIFLSATGPIGPPTLLPAAENPLVVSAAGGQVSASTTDAGGDIHLLSVGVLNLGVINTGTGSQTVEIEATGPAGDINLRADSTTGDAWTLKSSRDIQFFPGVTLTANSAKLTAASAIRGSGGSNTDIDTSVAGGAIELAAGGNIGDGVGLPLIVKAGNGDVSLDTSSGPGSIFLRSAGDLDLADVTTALGTQTVDIRADGGIYKIRLLEVYSDSDDWRLFAGGDLTFVDDANLAANSAYLLAISGNVVGGTGTLDDDVSTTGELFILGQKIGAADNRLIVTRGTMLYLEADSAAGMFVDIGGGGLATNQLTLVAPAAGTTIDLRLTDGAFTIDTNLAVADDVLTFTTQGTDNNISFLGNSTLAARSVTLDASGKIVSGDAALDIDATLGITLSGDIIGTGPDDVVPSDNPLAIRLGGDLSAEATSGNIWLFLPLSGLDTSDIASLTTPTHAATVSLVTRDDITVSTTGGLSTLTDDHLRVVSQEGGVNFTNQTLYAGSLEIRAATNIESSALGAALESTSPGGAIDLVAGSSILPGTGNIGSAVTALFIRTSGLISLDNSLGDGNIYLKTDGDLSLGAVATNDSTFGQQIDIETIGSDSSLALNTAISGNDAWSLRAGENFSLGTGVSLTASTFAVSAGGSIQGTATSLIDTSAENGTIDLAAVGNIGAPGNPLAINANFGSVFAATSGSGSDIHLSTPGPLVLGSIVSADGVHLQASGVILGSGLGTDIDTSDRAGATGGEIELIATGLSSTTTPLVLDNRGGNLRLTATDGDIFIRIAAGTPATTEGDLRTSQIDLISVAGDGKIVSLATTDGPIYLDDLSGFQANTVNDTLIFFAQGAGSSIVQAGAGPLVAQQVELYSQNLIGQAGSPVKVYTPNLFTGSPGNQHLGGSPDPLPEEPDPLLPQTVIRAAISDGTIYLASGAFVLDGIVVPFTFTPDFSILPSVQIMPTVELQGQGTIVGNLYVAGNARLDPGFSDTGTGQIEIFGETRFSAFSQIYFDINSPFVLPGRDYDQLRVLGPVDLGSATLKLRGAETLTVTISDIVLIDNVGGFPTLGRFLAKGDGSAVVDQINGVDRILIGTFFRGKLFYNGGDGNDVVISELSFAPPINRQVFKLPQFRLPLVAKAVVTLEEEPPLALTSPVEPPLLEVEVENVQVRKIEVRLVLPLDDQGNVREEKVLELEAAWLKNLSALFRRLPDDRYRIYLILEGGEARRVMDVIVRDGRPFEPEEARPAISPAPMPQTPAGSEAENDSPAPKAELPAVLPGRQLPEIDETPSLDLNAPTGDQSRAAEIPGGHASRLFLGAAAAAGLIAARRSADRWEQEIDEAAEEMAARPASTGSRWWRFGRTSPAEATS